MQSERGDVGALKGAEGWGCREHAQAGLEAST